VLRREHLSSTVNRDAVFSRHAQQRADGGGLMKIGTRAGLNSELVVVNRDPLGTCLSLRVVRIAQTSFSDWRSL
jgi:hypothetical protein